jgi:hypothetical protein
MLYVYGLQKVTGDKMEEFLKTACTWCTPSAVRLRYRHLVFNST